MWLNIVENTTVNATGAKDIPQKSTGNEKVHVGFCLTVKADGTNMKPFVVFEDAKREAASLNENFKLCCVVASSLNGLMNE